MTGAATTAATVTGTEVGLLVAVVALVIAAAFLSVADAALIRISRARAQVLVDEGRRGALALRDLLADPRSYLGSVRLVGLLCLLVQATLVGVVAERLFGAFGVVVAVTLDVLVTFVLADSAPRTLAAVDPERSALATAPTARFLAQLPPIRLLSRALIGLANVIVPGRGLEQGPYLSADELLAVADLSVQQGVIEADERALIESIIEFGDTVVREVMVPRPDMITVDASFRIADVIEVVLLNGYSRLPVRGEGIDDVIGLVYAKDLMRAERDGKENERVSALLRQPRFVPETKRVPEMLREMQHDQFHMAIVVDEYGGTAGLVTLEDLIEELVGEIVDEFDVENPLVEPLPGGGLRVHARTPLDDVNDLLHANLPEGDWDTIGGLLYRELGRVPNEGESVDVGRWRLVAERIQGRRIGRVLISPIAPRARSSAADTARPAGPAGTVGTTTSNGSPPAEHSGRDPTGPGPGGAGIPPPDSGGGSTHEGGANGR
jgi:putative hemolysin